jgi:hypothetical protein
VPDADEKMIFDPELEVADGERHQLGATACTRPPERE